MKFKIIESQNEGFSCQSLEKMWKGFLYYQSTATQQETPVHGVCFAFMSNPKSSVDDFVRHLKLGAVEFIADRISPDEWGSLLDAFQGQNIKLHGLCLIIHELNKSPKWLVTGLVHFLDNVIVPFPCFSTVVDWRMIPPELASMFLVYLGTEETGKMRYAIGAQQLMRIDKGSLRRASSNPDERGDKSK